MVLLEKRRQTLHVITGTNTGGAEYVLHQLLKSAYVDDVEVLSMMTPGPLARMLDELGVKVRTLGMAAGGRPSIGNMLTLRQITRALDPSLIQGWMYHGNLAALAATRPSRRPKPVIWGIHHTLTRLANEKPMTRAVIRLSARLSRRTNAIVYCSKQSARDHERLGFASDKTVIIPNGVDCGRFKPDDEASGRLRQELGIPDDRRIIGFVARFHPMKDHRNLIRAAKRLLDHSSPIHLVLVGAGNETQETELKAFVDECGIRDRVTFMGLREDLPSINPGFDIFCLPSAWGEAFPLVVCEAMASGVPCVVTDVGDAAWIVGDTGLVVPTRDSEALAKALQALLDLDGQALSQRGKLARRRIVDEFPLAKMAAAYQDLSSKVLLEAGLPPQHLVGKHLSAER